MMSVSCLRHADSDHLRVSFGDVLLSMRVRSALNVIKYVGYVIIEAHMAMTLPQGPEIGVSDLGIYPESFRLIATLKEMLGRDDTSSTEPLS